MTNDELKKLKKLIEFVDEEELKSLINKNEKFINYMNSLHSSCGVTREPICYKDNKGIIFTNRLTSMFFAKQSNFNFKLIKQNIIYTDKKEFMKIISPYRRTINLYSKTESEKANLTVECDIIVSKLSTGDIDTYSLNECLLMKQLLNNPEIYTSLKAPVLYAKNENGYAYILGKRNGSGIIL